MANKKNKGRARGGAAPAAEPDPQQQNNHASSSSSSAVTRPATGSTSAPAAAGAKVSEVPAISASAAKPQALEPAGSATACAVSEAFEDDDAFEDALEELTGAEGIYSPAEDIPPQTEEEFMVALVAKEPSLQVPTPSRADWDSEMSMLAKLVLDDSTPSDEKVRILNEALIQRVEDLRSKEEHSTATDRYLSDLTGDRDRYRKDTKAALAAKRKFEELCRNLQSAKANSTAENKKIVEDEQARQAELNEKFQAAMKDVEEKMTAESEIREHFIKENDELRTKLEKFTETYEEQERQLTEQCEVRGKEMEIAKERLKEYETKTVESKANATQLEKKNKTLQKTTTSLRAEMQSILSKFDEFHESVNGSSQRHGECKSEIDDLSMQLKTLEDENVELKGNKKAEEAQKEKDAAQKQCAALEKLCGNLQREIDEKRGGRNGTTGKKGGG